MFDKISQEQTIEFYGVISGVYRNRKEFLEGITRDMKENANEYKKERIEMRNEYITKTKIEIELLERTYNLVVEN